jgi:hypothetical protein
MTSIGASESRTLGRDAPRAHENRRGAQRSVGYLRPMSLANEDQAPPTEGGGGGWRRQPANRPVAHLLNLVFAGVGIFFLVGGYNQWAAVQPIAGGTTTTGTIVSVATGESCDRNGCSPNWTPTIRFTSTTGAAHTFTGPTGGQVSPGQTVTVSYLAADPSVAHDISASANQGVVLIGFGVFSLVLGVGSFVLGFAVLHRSTGLRSARPGGGWVGHKSIHSNQGALVGLAVVLALAVMGLLVY